MIHMLLTLLLSAIVAGCAAIGHRTEGVSGPVAWHVTDLRITQGLLAQDADGKARDRYEFTIVLKETQGTAITFTHHEQTCYEPGVSPAGGSSVVTGRWKLPPHGELPRPGSWLVYCAERPCNWGSLAPVCQSILTGTDDQDQPVRVVIDFRLPPNPRVVQTGQPPKPYAVIFTTGLTEDKKPMNDLTEISINEKHIYIFVQWHRSLTEHSYSSKIFDSSGKLLREGHAKFTPQKTLWNTWSSYNIKQTDRPGKWKFEIYLDGEKMVEQYLTVLPQ